MYNTKFKIINLLIFLFEKYKLLYLHNMYYNISLSITAIHCNK